jgi:hypothetical protein
MSKHGTYTKRVQSFLYILSALFIGMTAELSYLYSGKSSSDALLEKKSAFVQITGLPDLAISTEASYVRHRSLSTVSAIYKDDGSLREYFPSTYAISHSHILNLNAVKSKNEK